MVLAPWSNKLSSAELGEFVYTAQHKAMVLQLLGRKATLKGDVLNLPPVKGSPVPALCGGARASGGRRTVIDKEEPGDVAQLAEHLLCKPLAASVVLACEYAGCSRAEERQLSSVGTEGACSTVESLFAAMRPVRKTAAMPTTVVPKISPARASCPFNPRLKAKTMPIAASVAPSHCPRPKLLSSPLTRSRCKFAAPRPH